MLTSVKYCDINLRAFSQEMWKISIIDVSLKIANLRLHLHLPGANELAEQDLGTVFPRARTDCACRWTINFAIITRRFLTSRNNSLSNGFSRCLKHYTELLPHRPKPWCVICVRKWTHQLQRNRQVTDLPTSLSHSLFSGCNMIAMLRDINHPPLLS